jgi:CxxC motif-containing protein
MVSLTCSMCSMGCALRIENNAVIGNACPRGAGYARLLAGDDQEAPALDREAPAPKPS